MQVVTEKLELPPLSLQNPESIRLMTVDIGTTTIAMQLYDADGKVVDSFPSVNPQVSYGADVLSRIEAARDPGKAADMQKKVLDLIEKGAQRFSKKLQEKESIQMVIAANTTMTYLLMGWDPAELGRAPFQVSHCGAVDTQIAGISCHIIPGLSAFVGGDITAGILACQMLEQEEPMLLIDLGTNGEMALGNRQKLCACATAAGPAFEGGANRGIWGADMVRLLQKLLEEGLMTAEAFVTLTNMDEENVFLALYAKENSSAKLVTKVNRIAFDELISKLDLGSLTCHERSRACGTTGEGSHCRRHRDPDGKLWNQTFGYFQGSAGRRLWLLPGSEGSCSHRTASEGTYRSYRDRRQHGT